MCWVEPYRYSTRCQSRRNPNCSGNSVKKTWRNEGIYSYDGHAGGFKGYVSAYCVDCGDKWLEIPENYENLMETFGPDYDWYMGGKYNPMVMDEDCLKLRSEFIEDLKESRYEES